MNASAKRDHWALVGNAQRSRFALAFNFPLPSPLYAGHAGYKTCYCYFWCVPEHKLPQEPIMLFARLHNFFFQFQESTVPCTLGNHAFTHAAPVLWKSLPVTIGTTSSLSIFKQRLKSFLFKEAQNGFFFFFGTYCLMEQYRHNCFICFPQQKKFP